MFVVAAPAAGVPGEPTGPAPALVVRAAAPFGSRYPARTQLVPVRTPAAVGARIALGPPFPWIMFGGTATRRARVPVVPPIAAVPPRPLVTALQVFPALAVVTPTPILTAIQTLEALTVIPPTPILTAIQTLEALTVIPPTPILTAIQTLEALTVIPPHPVVTTVQIVPSFPITTPVPVVPPLPHITFGPARTHLVATRAVLRMRTPIPRIDLGRVGPRAAAGRRAPARIPRRAAQILGYIA
ncbi:hypothetical protein [Nocardia stercoris]|uniref:Uncharacterized protein n=1 Tax=Nocardia stercoris TaxID=2483361 RepID=A0A3M2KZP0_9NOCA|nr:hypothetical protein [Nocardia stercoris]RMI30614.1 hypothetical protein EBN03_21355 [Nocardia stercoris]